MRSIIKTAVFLLPVALITTFLFTSPKKAVIPSDLRDAVSADQLQNAAGPQTQPAVAQPGQPAPDAEAIAADEAGEKSICHRHHNNLPGCPGFCKKFPAHRTCKPPAYCGTNPNGLGCPKSADNKDAAADDQGFDKDLAKSHCTANPNAAGCPQYCHDHHSYPGCPIFCQLNPLNPSCNHIPAYCHTNPNGNGCPKSIETGTDEAVTAADEEDAKGRCHDHHNNLPGCPGFCDRHQEHRACALPFHCRNNMQLHACKMHCVQYPQSIGCGNKSAEEAGDKDFDEDLAKDNCAQNPGAPGCPLFCKDHHAYPGCPMFCQLNPLNPACKK